MKRPSRRVGILDEKVGGACGRGGAEKGQAAGGFQFFISDSWRPDSELVSQSDETTGGGHSMKLPDVVADPNRLLLD